MKNVVISTVTGTPKIGVFEKQVLEYFFVGKSHHSSLSVGDIYYGQVSKVLSGIDAAFVDIGEKRAVFLHKSDLYLTEDLYETPIDKILNVGQKLLVQIVKTPMGSKGARVTTKLSLASSYLVYLPHLNENKVSSKIQDLETREALLKKIDDLDITGVIARTAALEQTPDTLKKDCDYLKQRWNSIEQKMLTSTKSGLILREINESLKVIRDFAKYGIDTIYVDNQVLATQTQEFCDKYLKLENISVNLETDTLKRLSFLSQYSKLFNTTVALSCGGSIIIEQTESMITIDVNTASYLGRKNHDETILKTNLQAAQKIMSEIKLRQLGGIIIIDFIDMSREEDKELVEQELNKLALDDIMPMTVYPFTELGLVQISRKRSGNSLLKQMTSLCPCCQSTGRVDTYKTVAEKIIDEILSSKELYHKKEIKVIGHDQVLELLTQKIQPLESMLKALKISITTQADNFQHHNYYEIHPLQPIEIS